MEYRPYVGWCWSVSADNVCEQSDKINLKVEKKGRNAMRVPKIKFLIFAVAAFIMILYPPLVSASPILGSAQSFAVLGASTVTNGHSPPNPTTQIHGNLGVTPGTSVTGFYPDGTVSGGTIHINDGVAQLALANATTAYNTLAGLPFFSPMQSTVTTPKSVISPASASCASSSAGGFGAKVAT